MGGYGIRRARTRGARARGDPGRPFSGAAGSPAPASRRRAAPRGPRKPAGREAAANPRRPATRLEGPLEPFDAIEIATAALALFEQDAFQEGERRQEAVVEPNTQAELARALIEALKTLLAGWPLDGDARPVMEGLLRRLNAPLEPFDALEIAGEALGAIEQNARESKERLRQSEDQRRAADQQAELAGASVRALQMVLEGAPCSSEADGPAEPRAKRVLVELRRRCEGPLQAADVIGIAREAVTVMQEQAAVQRRVQPDPPPAEQPPQTLAKPDALSQALLQALQMLLGNWPFPGGSGRETERPGREKDRETVASPGRAARTLRCR